MKVQIEKTSKEIKKLYVLSCSLGLLGFLGSSIHPLLSIIMLPGAGILLFAAAKQWWEHG